MSYMHEENTFCFYLENLGEQRWVLKIRQEASAMSPDEITVIEDRIISLLQDEDDPSAREELNQLLSQFNVAFEAAIRGCICLFMFVVPGHSPVKLLNGFLEGQIAHVVNFLLELGHSSGTYPKEVVISLHVASSQKDLRGSEVMPDKSNNVDLTECQPKDVCMKGIVNYSSGISLILRRKDHPGTINAHQTEKLVENVAKFIYDRSLGVSNMEVKLQPYSE